MNILAITRIIAIVGLALGLLGIILKIKDIMNRPFKKDLARERGSTGRAILFAFTLGMAPWEKESTRIHWIAYLRGIFFHVGIFMAFGVLLAANPFRRKFANPPSRPFALRRVWKRRCNICRRS